MDLEICPRDATHPPRRILAALYKGKCTTNKKCDPRKIKMHFMNLFSKSYSQCISGITTVAWGFRIRQVGWD